MCRVVWLSSKMILVALRRSIGRLLLLLLLMVNPVGAATDCSKSAVDIVFAVDQSGSIGVTNFAKLKAYLVQRVNLIPFSDAAGPRVAILGFSTTVTLYCDMRFDKASLLTCIDSVPYVAGWTNTPEAITQAGAELTRANCGASRTCVIELITDGDPNLGPGNALDPTQLEAESQQRAATEKGGGRVINAVGLGTSKGLTASFLSSLTSTPTASHWARIDDYDNLELYAVKVAKNCGVSTATPCAQLPVDTVFAVDQSPSIGAANFAKLKAYLVQRVNLIPFSDGTGPRVAVLGFAGTVTLHCDMRFDKASLLNCIDQMPYTGSGTNTPEAIKQAGAELTRANCDPATRICLIELVTDGEPNLGPSHSLNPTQLEALTLQYATTEKGKRTIINAVGLGTSTGLQARFLSGVASAPSQDHWARIDDYDNLEVYASKVARTCGLTTGVDCDILPVDTVFALDQSGSIGAANFAKLKAYVAARINLIPFSSATGPRVAILGFHTTVAVHCDMRSDKVSLLACIDQMPYPAGWTNTPEAIKQSGAELARAGCDGTARICVIELVTDGEPNLGPTNALNPTQLETLSLQHATTEKEKGTIINAVGVGTSTGLTSGFLGSVASTPAGSHSARIDDYDNLNRHAMQVSKTCGLDTAINCDILPVDTVFVVDQSGSIGATNFVKLKEYLLKRISLIPFSNAAGPRVAILGFSTEVTLYCDMRSDHDSLVTCVHQIPYVEGWTNTPEAIRQSGAELTRAGCDGVARVCLIELVTDGQPNLGPTYALSPAQLQAQSLQYAADEKGKGTFFNALGVGSSSGLSESFLASVASTPAGSHAARIDDYDSLDLHALKVSKTCGLDAAANCGILPVDTVFALDQSGSIGAVDFAKLKAYVAARINLIPFSSATGPRVAILGFHTTVAVHCDMRSDKVSLLACIDQMPYPAGWTNTPEAIKQSGAELARAGCDGVARICLIELVTDGEPNLGPTNALNPTQLETQSLQHATTEKGKGTIINAVGVGTSTGLTSGFLGSVASTPAGSHSARINDYDNLEIHALKVSKTCGLTTGVDCNVLPVDTVFVLDQSGSIGAANFAKLKAYVAARITRIPFSSATGPRVAILGFHTTVAVHCDMRSDKVSLLACIDQMPYPAGWTNTPEAIKQSGAELARAGCDGTARICVIELVTDGEPNLGPTNALNPTQLETLSLQHATTEKGKGTIINAVGVGTSTGLTSGFLGSVASTPAGSHSARIDDYDNLEIHAMKVSTTCGLNAQVDCDALPVDTVFVVDQSGSIGATNFVKLKEYVAARIKAMPFSSGSGPRAAVIGFHTTVEVYCQISSDSSSLLNCVNQMPYPEGWTNTPEAIQAAGAELARAGCDPLQRICVIEVITDGRPNLGPTNALNPDQLQAQSLEYGSSEKAKGYRINAVGVGGDKGLSPRFLEGLASAPTARHWARIDDYDNLELHAKKVPRPKN